MLPIIVGAIAMFAFGAVWFTFLFGKTWARLMDFNPAGDAKAKEMGMVKPMIINFLLNVVAVSVVYYIFPQVMALSFGEFWKIIFVIWLGFSFTIYANSAVWERKSWMLVLINSVQSLLAFTIASAIVYFWR